MASEKNSSYHHGNLRASLIEAALQRLSEQTVDTLSLRNLAKMEGVSVAAVYRHFPNKDALLAEVAVDGFTRLVQQWETSLPRAEEVGAEARFRRLGELYVEFALASPAHYRLMFGQSDLRRFPDLRAAAAKCFAYVLGAATDMVHAVGAEPKWALPLANAAWSSVHGYVMLSLGSLLTKSANEPDLPANLITHFVTLPDEALPAASRRKQK